MYVALRLAHASADSGEVPVGAVVVISGEIAGRVMSTCRRMAIRIVAVHASIDAHALHVETADEAYLIGGPRPAAAFSRSTCKGHGR